MDEKMKAMEMSVNELEQAVGGNGVVNYNIVVGKTYTSHVKTGYLALRTAAAYDPKNEIGHLWNGSTVTVTSYSGGNYAWVHVVNDVQVTNDWIGSCTGKDGYVDVRYLQ